MKKLNLLLTMLFVSALVVAQSNGPEIKFENTTYDYGVIEQNSSGVSEFVYKCGQ